MEIFCRKYLEKDAHVVLELMSELGYETALPELTASIEVIRNNGGEIFVAEYRENPVGCICALIDARLAEGVYAEIVSLVVLKGARGKGVGSALINTAESWGKKRVGNIRIRANEKRTNAHEYYIKRGYAEIKTQKVFTKKLIQEELQLLTT